MTILSIQVDQVGLAGVKPRIIHIDTNDTVATITTAGYLNSAVRKENFQFSESDMALVVTRATPASRAECGWYDIDFSSNNWSLTPASSPGEVVLPTTANHIATYTNATGTLSQDPATALLTGNLQVTGDIVTTGANDIICQQGSLISGTATGDLGNLLLFPDTAAKGSFNIFCSDNADVFGPSLTNASFAQATTIKIPDPGTATASLLISTLAVSDKNANIVPFAITVTATALASAGVVTLYTATAAAQYRIIEIFLSTGTNFSGGGGDRLATISDGTTAYSVIPAANLQALTNARWGSTPIPFPAAAANHTLTVAGQNLRIAYSGGATDYAAGSVLIYGLLARFV